MQVVGLGGRCWLRFGGTEMEEKEKEKMSETA